MKTDNATVKRRTVERILEALCPPHAFRKDKRPIASRAIYLAAVTKRPNLSATSM